MNEIAPRPHNSGHFSIEACPVSQYDAHLRAILKLAFPTWPSRSALVGSSPGTDMLTPSTVAIMLNLLGGPEPHSHLALARRALEIPGATCHLYGKGDARPGRKMGHITIVADSMARCHERITPLLDLDKEMNRRSDKSIDRGLTTSSHEMKSKQTSVGSISPQAPPAVSITMGSDSDLPILKPGMELLRELEIDFEVTITSAHRTPSRMFHYARDAFGRGVKVIIAAAGGAAHLPGMLAASTPLPVIGVPVKASHLDGIDSLLSIVQMPVSLGSPCRPMQTCRKPNG